MLSSNTGLSVNEHGVIVSLHRCNVCHGEFTLCPPFMGGDFSGCLAVGCESYDETRDVDKMFEGGENWRIERG